MIIAVIPARGGSKRIPRKNIQHFAGKPIMSYSIEAALQCGLFDRVVVSTDDDEIAAVARRCGAETPFRRPVELADDFAGTNAVTRHAIEWFQQHVDGVQFACCIYATAVFVQAEDLSNAFELLSASDKAFAFSVTSFEFPIQRAIKIGAAGEIEPFFPEYISRRSQDLEPAYHDAGQFYWGRAQAFLDNLPTFSAASLPYILPRHRVQDIDTLEDWERAEWMFRTWKGTSDR